MLCLIGESIEAHLLHHGDEAIATGGGEVLFEANLLDEVEVGIGNLFGGMAREDLHQKAYDTLHDEGIALGLEHEATVHLVGLQPYAALASLDEVAVGLVLLGQRLLLTAEVDEELVLVHPVVQFAELLNNLVLYFVDGHFLFLLSHRLHGFL